jgi:cytochrome c-type biogenesis protein CcmH
MMPIFILLAALMVAVALAFVLTPLLRQSRPTLVADASARRLHALDEALSAGVIDADEYAAKRALIDQAAAPATAIAPSRARLTSVAVLAVALLLPATALFLYRLVGAPQALDPANLAVEQATRHGDPGPAMQQAIATLVGRLKEHPDDAQGWALLGRAYQATGHADESLAAFKRAHQQATDNTGISVEYAQAIALAASDHRIQGESRNLLEAVLKADPQNQRALWLLGISDYQAKQYDAAIARWNSLLPLLSPDSDVAQSVRKQIADAQTLQAGGHLPAPSPGNSTPAQNTIAQAGDATTTADSSGTAATTNAPKLTVHVTLDPKLKSKLDPDATLFVFARAASGPPMPLAVQRLKASQLPITVTLDESMGMLPTMKLSKFPRVIVGARISKSGNAMQQSGDLQTVSAPLDVQRKDTITLNIDQSVP